MNKQKQRIAIAEACGWIPHPDNANINVKHWTLGGSKYGERGAKRASSKIINDDTWGLDQSLLPDYLNDLNAMHEAEKMLTAKQWDEYGGQLECTPYVIQNWIHATAARRAEAFLKTLNLWTVS